METPGAVGLIRNIFIRNPYSPKDKNPAECSVAMLFMQLWGLFWRGISLFYVSHMLVNRRMGADFKIASIGGL